MSAFGHLLTDAVSYKAPMGIDDHGDPSYGALAALSARVEYSVRHGYSGAGVRREQSTVVVTESEIPIGSLLWLPGTDTAQLSQAKTVDTVRKASIPGGATLYEAIL